jgi:hypothetical protein
VLIAARGTLFVEGARRLAFKEAVNVEALDDDASRDRLQASIAAQGCSGDWFVSWLAFGLQR